MNWIDRHRESPSINKDKESEDEEEDVRATQSSTENNSPIEKYEEGRQFDWDEHREDTGLSDEKNTEEEASLRHKGESPSLDLSDSEDNDDDDDKTGDEDNT